MQIPPETPEETTQELPPVPPAGQPAAPHQPEHLTVGLPLLDLLAPQQTAPQQATHPVGPPQAPYQAGPPYAAAPLPPPIAPGPYGPVPAAAPQRGPSRRGPNRRGALLVGGLGAAVVVLAILGVWALGSSDPPRQSRPSPTSAPQTSAVKAAGGFQFTQHAARTDTDCGANAYGKVAEFFRATPCAKLDRGLYAATVDGRLVVVSVSVVQMPDEAKATELKKLADTSGTGNVNDLLRAGVRVPGGPESLTDAGYASARDRAVVVIAEADFADRATRDEGTLDRVSTAALQLRQ